MSEIDILKGQIESLHAALTEATTVIVMRDTPMILKMMKSLKMLYLNLNVNMLNLLTYNKEKYEDNIWK